MTALAINHGDRCMRCDARHPRRAPADGSSSASRRTVLKETFAWANTSI